MGIEDLRLILPLSSKRRAQLSQLQYHPHAVELHGNRGSEVSTYYHYPQKEGLSYSIIHMLGS